MNHFLLWVGTDACAAMRGSSLLPYFKSVEAVRQLEGKGWWLFHAAQKDGLGAFRDDRRRVLRAPVGADAARRELLWFGHMWSAQDGNQAPLSVLDRCPEDTGAVGLIEKARENSDGVYALFVADEGAGKLAIASDLCGSFHIYYRRLADAIAVSNSSALLATLPPLARLDAVGVQEMCSNSIPNEDRSLWHEVRKLRSWEILSLDTRRTRHALCRHRPLVGTLSALVDYPGDPVADVHAGLGSVLDVLDSFGARGQQDRHLPWAVDLTGGNDSRALMAAIVARKINAASTVTGPEDDPDVRISESLAHVLGIPQYTRSPARPIGFAQFMEAVSLTDGEFDGVEYAGIAAVHRQHIADGLQFSLNGSYCEVARGHAFRMGLAGMLFPDTSARRLCRRGRLDLAHPSVVRWQQVCSLKPLPGRLFSAAALHETTDYFPAMFDRLLAYAGDLPQHAQLDLVHLDLRMERWQGRIASSTNQLWPSISPWSFRLPLSAVLSSAPQRRRNGLLTREFTFRYAPEIAVEPLYTGNPAMPFSLGQLGKFLPVVPFFADRAAHKIRTRLFSVGKDAGVRLQDYQPALWSAPEVRDWMQRPLLLDSGLFDPARLQTFMANEQPQSELSLKLWCRLLTIEAALRRQGELSRASS